MHAADGNKPAADLAAQAAAGMAMLAKYFRSSKRSTAGDRALADRLEPRARAAYDYSQRMVTKFGSAKSTCSNSPANDNCIGVTCLPPDQQLSVRSRIPLFFFSR
jgi:hypothetical protein